jgi:hypothetical protein
LNLNVRKEQHFQVANKGKRTRLCQEIRNCGIKNFDIKEVCSLELHDYYDACEVEMALIKILKPELNKNVRRVRTIGMKQYQREWQQRVRDSGIHSCEICDVSFAAKLHLMRHLETKKHKRNEQSHMVEYYSNL